MRKTISFLILSLTFASLAIFAQASISSDFTLQDASYNQTEPWKRLQFDKLALDVVIPSNNGEVDFLQAFSIMNLGTAYYGKGIGKLVLWTDERTTGFQGMGIDKKVGEANWDATSFTWYWKDMALIIPEDGLRVFISVEVEDHLDDSRTVQLVIPKLIDNNDDGKFDIGDKGVFVYSGNDGPADKEINNISTQSIRYGPSDQEGPKSVITNLFDGNQIPLQDNFIISGLSKDQGRLSSKLVQISIVEQGSPDNWQDVFSDRLDFGRWTYNWSIPGTGDYDIRLKSRDLVENETISDIITITVADNGGGIVSANQSKLSIDYSEAKADGRIYVNALVEVKDENGNPLANRNVELSYIRSTDNYIARNTQTTDEKGVLVWGMPATVAGKVTLTAIIGGVELDYHPEVLFVSE
ncbi:Ig-like domain-containing protein [Candidatus Parcubacteria bacterium]|nr:Ig-like domain-containing protein [Candidatus Parcubacteria bacterium]